MLRYPNFNRTEYNPLDAKLYVVDFVLELERLEEAQAQNELELQQALNQARQGDAVVKHDLLDVAVVKLHEHDEKVRQAMLRSILNDFKETQDRPTDYGFREKRKRLASAALEVYAGFKIELFERDFAAISDTADDAVKAAEVSKFEGKKEKLAKELGNLWKKLPKCFTKGQYPMEFRGQKIAGTESEGHVEIDREQMARMMVRAFVKDWRDRAPLFTAPVTVLGTGIHTLPSDKKKVWSDAYSKLALGERRTVPLFQWTIDAPVAQIKEEAPVAPGSFFGGKE